MEKKAIMKMLKRFFLLTAITIMSVSSPKKILIPFTALVLFAITTATVGNAIFEKTTIFSLQYGQNDNEIGIFLPMRISGIPVEGELSRGPCDFWIDDSENVYISDCINHKLKKFDKSGNIIYISPEIEPLDYFAVSDNGEAYVVSGVSSNIIVKVSPEGNIVKTEREDDRERRTGRRIGSELAVQIAQIPGYRFGNYGKSFTDKYGRTYEFDVSQKGIYVINIFEGSNRILSSRIAPLENNVPNTSVSTINKSETPQPFVDENGQLYAWGLKKRDQPVTVNAESGIVYIHDVIVHKFSITGEITDTMVFPGGDPFETGGLRDAVRIGKSGDVYSLEFEIDKVNIIKRTW